MRIVLQLALLLFCVQASAQEKSPLFQSTVQLGLLEGENGSAFQLQTVHGFNLKTWFAGVGTGLDYYHTRTIPLFVSLRKSFSHGVKTPFVYFNGGYHFPWLRQQDKLWAETKASGGLYYDAGIGYQLPVMKTSALFFTAGFSQKNFQTSTDYNYYIDIWPQPAPQRTVHDYSLRRLSIQTGLRF
ncbi:MAG: hypothetical protein EOO14_09890 [Chitinophagaceae bacterium]|nr:MAG: hypothetical protein EOO14_09890 [Chitinophagaceae bacterium]